MKGILRPKLTLPFWTHHSRYNVKIPNNPVARKVKPPVFILANTPSSTVQTGVLFGCNTTSKELMLIELVTFGGARHWKR